MREQAQHAAPLQMWMLADAQPKVGKLCAGCPPGGCYLLKRNKQPHHKTIFHIEGFFIVKYAWGEGEEATRLIFANQTTLLNFGHDTSRPCKGKCEMNRA